MSAAIPPNFNPAIQTAGGHPILDTHAMAPAAEGFRYVARQAILDTRGNVHGYELLFRSSPFATSFQGDGNEATRTVLDNALVFGLEELTGGVPVFVNCTSESLLDRLVMVLPPQFTVLELLETLEPTPGLVKVCRELQAMGYRLALDDFENKPEWEPLLRIADYVKIDLSTTTSRHRASLIQSLRGSHAQLVAERVETRADLEMAMAEGFTLFQGYFFCKPLTLEHRRIPANSLIHLELLQAVHEEPLDIRRISDLVKRDASLTYRLLRIVNSPLYGLRKVIGSIHAALVLVGDEVFRRVATLAITCELRGKHPSELLRIAFVRGRFCELAASVAGQNPTEQYLLGILSLLPAMLGTSMESIAEVLPLRCEVRAALLGEQNAVRTLLDWILYYEQGQWERCDTVAQLAGLQSADLPGSYTQALLWAEKNMSLTS